LAGSLALSEQFDIIEVAYILKATLYQRANHLS
jgi:hypothetical protein